MAGGARQADEPGEPERAARDQDDVLAGDGEQVVEPRAPEARLEAVAQPRVVAENDAFEDRAPFSRQAG